MQKVDLRGRIGNTLPTLFEDLTNEQNFDDQSSYSFDLNSDASKDYSVLGNFFYRLYSFIKRVVYVLTLVIRSLYRLKYEKDSFGLRVEKLNTGARPSCILDFDNKYSTK